MGNGLISALIFDIDGSIMPQGGPIDPKVAEFFRRLQTAGLKMGPATGKNADYCRGLACGIGVVWDYIIAETGAQFLELISANPPSFRQRKLQGVDDDLSRFLDIIDYKQFGRTFRFYDRDENFRPELKEGILTLFPAGSEIDVTLPWVSYFEGIVKHFRLSLNIQRHSDGCIDVVPSVVSKALGIRNVCDLYGIGERNILTVADGKNDDQLVEGRLNAIVVGNGNQSLKDAARAIGGYVAGAPCGDGFIEGMKYFNTLEEYFEPKVAEEILHF